MAEALAAAGADIVGTSLTIDSVGSEARRASRGTGGCSRPTAPISARRTGPRGWPLGAPRRAESTSSSTTRGRSRVHRRWCTTTSSGDACCRTNLTSQFVLARELGAADGRARGRQDHLHRVHAELPGRDQRRLVHGIEVGRRRARARARERVGAPRRERERDRPGVLRDRQHATAAGRSGAVTCDPRADPRRPVGRPGRPRGGDRLPRLGRFRLRARASCSPSTAAGSGDDRRTGQSSRSTGPPGRHGREPGDRRQLGGALAGGRSPRRRDHVPKRGSRGSDRSPRRRGLRRRRRHGPLGRAGGVAVAAGARSSFPPAWIASSSNAAQRPAFRPCPESRPPRS